MNLFVVFSLINGVTAVLFGVFVFLKNRKDLINKTFFLMSLGVAIWSFSYCKWLLTEEREIALFWSRALNFGATLIPIFYLHWVLSLLNLAKEKRKLLIAGYLMTFIFLSLGFTPYYIKSVIQILSFPYWPQAGPLYICFLFLGYFSLVGYGLYQLLKNRKTTSGEKRAQIDYVILGTILGFGGGATNFPLMFGVSLLPPIGQPLVALYVLLLALATIRYHLFEIRVILTEALVIATGLTLLVWSVTAEPFMLKILGGALFVFFIIFGYQLVKSVIKEIELRAELERAYQELEKIDKAKTEFLSIASHQLRTPLTSTKGYISMILEGDYGEVPEQAREKLENVLTSNQRLVKLINDLLDITRLEMGRIELSLKKANLEEIISGVVEEMKMAAEKKGLYLKWEPLRQAQGKQLPEISIDMTKIREVILNLVDNAIKYTQQGGITIKLKIENLKLEIAIADTGVGMEKEEIENLFEIMARGKAGFQYWTEGAGVGLYTARKFAEMHGGRVWAESPGKDKGSTFYVELPVK